MIWKWSVWIEGADQDLDQIKEVTYRLHWSFPDPLRTIRNRATKFKLDSKGWGIFEIPVKVVLHNGEIIKLRPFRIAASDPLAAVLRNVKGRNRREMIRDYYEAGKLDQLSDELPRDSLSDDAKISLGKVHPYGRRIPSELWPARS